MIVVIRKSDLNTQQKLDHLYARTNYACMKSFKDNLVFRVDYSEILHQVVDGSRSESFPLGLWHASTRLCSVLEPTVKL